MSPNSQSMSTSELDVRFSDSFGHVFCSTLAMIASATTYEGLDQWVYVTFAALSDDLRWDILNIFDPIALTWIFERLVIDEPKIEGFPEFITWLSSIDEQAIHNTTRRIFRSWARKASRSGTGTVEVPALEDENAVQAFLDAVSCESARLESKARRELSRLLSSPQRFRERVGLIATRFWESTYRRPYQETRGRIDRSIAYHRQVNYSGGFEDVYAAVTGKMASKPFEEAYAGLETLVLVPSCYPGPYIRYVAIDEERKSLVIIFNARSRSQDEDHVLRAISASFPSLKALADETRLEILGILAHGELYGQQIVDRLAISQPAVSRHLRLMVAAGILKERREEGMKFYRISAERLSELTKQIAVFATWGSD